MISKGDQVIVSSSEHNTDHTALEIGKAEDRLQLWVPNLEKHQQIEQMYQNQISSLGRAKHKKVPDVGN